MLSRCCGGSPLRLRGLGVFAVNLLWPGVGGAENRQGAKGAKEEECRKISRLRHGAQGAPAATLLPQWLSGYSFLFPDARDLERARQVAPRGAAPIAIAYDPQDSGARRPQDAGSIGQVFEPARSRCRRTVVRGQA